MKAAAIELAHVSMRFGPKVVLDAVDMRVDEGTVFGFLGGNGAGKTTTVRLLLGLLRVGEGQVRVLGYDPAVDAQEIRRRVGVLLDHDGHYDRLTALQNLEFHADIRRLDRASSRRRIEELLGTLHLWEHRGERVGTFSKGMRQKLAVARTLVSTPKLLLLDEPFTGLDPAAAVDLRDRLRALASGEGVTILLTTHDLHHVEKICDRVAVLDCGRVAAAGTLGELRGEGDGQEVLVVGERLGEEILSALVAEGLASGYRRLAADRAVVQCAGGGRKRLATALVMRGVELCEIGPYRTTLEETFMNIVAPR